MPVPTVDIIVPSGPVYEGTSQTLTCNVTLPPSVDTDVNLTVNWRPEPLSTDRATVHQPSTMTSSFISTLVVSPVGMNESGRYSCEATASSSSEHITPSSSGNSSQQNLTVTGKSTVCTTSSLLFSHLFTALPPPDVTTFSLNQTFTAGTTYTINCSATVVHGLVVQPNMKIASRGSNVVSVSNKGSVEYTFSPLATSDGGQYNCTATVNIPEVGITGLKSSATKTITVAG